MTLFLIEPKCSPGMVLDVSGAEKNNGTNIQIWNLGEGIHQYFKFKNSGDAYFFIEACHCSGKVIDVRQSEVKNCTNIHLWEKNGSDAQKFKKVHVGNGYYTFKSKLDDNFCIDTQFSGKEKGTNIWLYECNDTDAQKFKLINRLEGSIQYAQIYSQKRNPKYKDYGDNNCTNFCSQCLVAGGISYDNIWRNESPAFINTLQLKDYFSYNKGVKFLESPNINDIDRGDIIYCQGTTDKFDQVMFVIGKDGDNVIFCGNINNRYNDKIHINSITGVLKTSDLLI